MVWVTADQHFSHTNILKYTHRPFDDIDQMDSALIHNWNSKVGPHDITFVIGDLTMNNKNHPMHLIEQLNGHIILILGNHDCKPAFYKKTDKIIKTFKSFRYHGVFLVHNVVDSPVNEYVMCGHIHEVWKMKLPGQPSYSKGKFQVRKKGALNVGVDVWDFSPIKFETALDLLHIFG